MRPQIRLEEEIGRLANLPRAELVKNWQAIYGRLPPRGIKRPLLERAIAWHLQVKALGGISAADKRILRAALPSTPDLNTDANRVLPVSRPAPRPPKNKLRPGARLVREWHGRTHVVNVTENGFIWNGRQYASISRIAREIIGTRWSGPRFFGL